MLDDIEKYDGTIWSIWREIEITILNIKKDLQEILQIFIVARGGFEPSTLRV